MSKAHALSERSAVSVGRWRGALTSALVVLAVALSGCGKADDDAGLERTDDDIVGSFPVGAPLETTAEVNQRAAPDRTSAVLQVIPANVVVRSAAASPKDGWYGVTWNGKTGWVFGDFLVEPAPAGTKIDLRTELGASGKPGRVAIAIGHAEGSVSLLGNPTDAYFGHFDSARWNIGLWSCTVCGAQGELTPSQANRKFFEDFLAPSIKDYVAAGGGRYADDLMVAATFFGLVVQSPEAALQDANARDLSLLSMLKRAEITRPLSEDKLVEALLRSWTVDGRIRHSLGPDGARHDQRRRVRAYADSLRAQGVEPYR